MSAAKQETFFVKKVDDEISSVVEMLEEQGNALVVPHIANMVYSKLDEAKVSPHVIQYLSQQEIKQKTRAYLRRRHDPIERAEQAVEKDQEDLFADTLQDYYPVKRDIMGERQRIYTPRNDLTKSDVSEIAGRLSRAGSALIRHADGLVAWDKSR